MKFLFINKPFLIEPLGIMYIAAAIKNASHEVDSALTSEDLEKKVQEFNPDFIGYSIMTGDQIFYDNINRRLKEKHKFVSVAGGPHPTFFPEVLGTSSFDAICLGEGEGAIKQLVDNPDSTQIDNFWFKRDNQIIRNHVRPLIDNLDEIEYPDRALVFKYDKIRAGPIKHFIASRGCPFNCSYCFNAAYSALYRGKGQRVRFRSVDNLLDEVKEVVSSSPTKFVYFQDDTFILDPDWIREFSEKYPQEIRLPFHCHTRANLVTNKIVKELKDAGCYSVHIAAEAGNEQVRREVLNRSMTNEQILASVNLFRRYDIKIMLQNILGLPFTTLQNDFETLELNIKCSPDYAWASIFQPYPRTRLGERCVESGLYTGDFSDISDSFFEESALNIPNRNEIANLQKLFAIAVKHPELYHSGRLQALISMPYEKTKERFTKAYKDFRKNADRILYGLEL